MRSGNSRKTDGISKWEKIFCETLVDGKKKMWRLVTIISLVALVGMTFLQIVYIKNTENVYLEALGDIFNFFLIPVTTAILSAAFLNIVYVTYENRQLKSIKKFSYKELAQKFFEVLDEVGEKKRRNEHIDVSLLPFKKDNQINPRLLRIKIKYEYETNTLKDFLYFMFERNRNGDIVPYISSSNPELQNYEFYWGNDETGTFPASEVSDEDYAIEQISIGSYPVPMDTLLRDVSDTDSGKLIIYRVHVPEETKNPPKEYYRLTLTVSFPMEAESILFITHEYPTESSEMSVKYSEIQDSTMVYTMPMTGPIPVKNQNNSSEDSFEQYRYDGWLIPKTGYVISWWKKDRESDGTI